MRSLMPILNFNTNFRMCASHLHYVQEYLPGSHSDLPKYHFVLDEDTPDTHAEATDPDAREEGNAEAWTPLVSVRVYIYFMTYGI